MHSALNLSYYFCLGTEVPRHSAGSNRGCTLSKACAVKQHMDQVARGWGIAAVLYGRVRVRRNERARTRSS